MTRGRLEVIKDTLVLTHMGANEFFGERSLLTDQPVGATIRAATFCDLMMLEKSDVLHILHANPQARDSRTSRTSLTSLTSLPSHVSPHTSSPRHTQPSDR